LTQPCATTLRGDSRSLFWLDDIYNISNGAPCKSN